MKYTREQIEAYHKEIKEYVKNKYPHRRLNFSIIEEFLEHKFPKLPEEGLLVSREGSLVYKLSDGKGYGFSLGRQSCYLFDRGWNFDIDDYWKPATPEQEEKFVKMLEIECETHLLFENTKIECHAKDYPPKVKSLLNQGLYDLEPTCQMLWNKNGVIFHKGKFATPRKEETILTQISKVIKDREDFSVERTESGLIILTPKNK